MRFLQSIVQPLMMEQIGDESLPDQDAFPRVIHQLLVNVGFELAVFAARQPYFSLPNTSNRLALDSSRDMSAWPSGFVNAEAIVPRLLELLTKLGDHFDGTLQDLYSLSSVFRELEAWDPYNATGSAYSFFQTQAEDDINAQAHYSLRTAGLGLCWSIRRALQIEFGFHLAALDWTSSSGVLDMDVFMAQSTPWHPDALVGTVFEELALWALLVTCIVSHEMDHKLPNTKEIHESIRRTTASSAIRNGITTPPQINDLLQRYVLPQCWTDTFDRCKTLCKECGIGPDGQIHMVSLRTVESPTSSHRTMATRYDRRTHHPDTIVKLANERGMCSSSHRNIQRPWE